MDKTMRGNLARLITDYLEYAADEYKNKVAFSDEYREITYDELRQEALLVAQRICVMQGDTKDKQGFKKRQRPIAIYIDRSIDCIVSMLGIAYSGNFYTVLDVSAPYSRINEILDVLEPELMITDSKQITKILDVERDRRILNIEEISSAKLDYNYLRQVTGQVSTDDVLYVMFTSGSTGKPKGVVTSHRAVIEYIEAATKNYQNINEEDVFGNQYPFYYIASIDDIYLPIRNGATTQVIPKKLFYSPAQLINYIMEKKINVINWVPSALAIIEKFDALDGVDLTNVKKVIFGGEAMPVKVLNYWRRSLPEAVFINGYGATETTEGTTYYIVDREFDNMESVPIGKPLDNVEIILADADGNEVANGEVGEIYVKTSALSYGYYKDAQKTNAVFVQNPVNKLYSDIVYKTGDLARQDQEGNYIYVGRTDQQVKINGNRVELGDIESHVSQLEGVEQCVCLYKNELICVYTGEAEEKFIYQGINTELPQHMIPNRYYRIDKFPLNANGKVDRVKVANMVEEL